jgi:drug/metabolite transporter (DMT)-like permease
MYNYVQPIIACIVAVWLGLDTFGLKAGIATAMVFVGVFMVTQSKSKEK